MSPRLLLLAVVSAFAAVPAGAVIFIQTYSVGTDVTDHSSSGLLNTQTVSLAEPIITSISIGLSISPTPGQSAFLGDLYAYVEHNGVISVLVNRPGVRVGELAGFDDNQSMNVTFTDGSPDFHSYRVSLGTPLASPLTGTWGPDGRSTDPATVLDTDSRTRPLNSFVGANANGQWNLFVADLSGGGAHRLDNWTLDITTAAVPEPQVWVGASLILGWAGWRLRKSRSRREVSR